MHPTREAKPATALVVLYRRSVDGPETASILTRPDERRFRLRHHLLPTAVVLVGIGGLVVVGALVFVLVFLVDDRAELGLGDVGVGLVPVGAACGDGWPR